MGMHMHTKVNPTGKKTKHKKNPQKQVFPSLHQFVWLKAKIYVDISEKV